MEEQADDKKITKAEDAKYLGLYVDFTDALVAGLGFGLGLIISGILVSIIIFVLVTILEVSLLQIFFAGARRGMGF